MKKVLKHSYINLFIALGSVALTACSLDVLPSKEFVEEKLNIFGTQEIICPNLRILRAGEIFITAPAESNSTTTESIKLAEIETVRASCRIQFPNKDTTTSFTKYAILTTELDIYIRFVTGAGGHQNSASSLPYFVALINRFGKITTKQVFATSPEAAAPASQTNGLIHEKIVVNIPIDDLSEAEGYEMLVGFQLSEDQMEDFRRRDR